MSANDETHQRASRFMQPMPEIPSANVSSFEFVRAVRRNGLHLWSQRAYELDYLKESLFGLKRVLLNKPEMIHRVLVENHGSYSRTDTAIRLFRPLVGDGLLLATGENWKHQRRTIAPALAPKMLPLLTRHVAACADEEVRSLSERDAEPLDLLHVMQSLALKIAARSMFSLETWEYGPAVRAEMRIFMQRHARASLADLVMPQWMPNFRDIGRARFRRRWSALVDRIIDARERVPDAGGPRDLFDALRTARDPETGAGFGRAELRDQIGTMIVAGHETTALTLFWSLYLLANTPAEQAAVAAEVRDVDLSPERAGEALNALPYTRAVISETLRLYPSAWLITRKCIEPDQMEGLAVERGTQMMISPWVLHHHRDYWSNPTAFDPSRFLPGAPPPPRFTYLPFGAGPRVCVGAQFALAETTVVLARLIQAFEVEFVGDEPLRPLAVATTTPDRPTQFRLKRRAR